MNSSDSIICHSEHLDHHNSIPLLGEKEFRIKYRMDASSLDFLVALIQSNSIFSTTRLASKTGGRQQLTVCWI